MTEAAVNKATIFDLPKVVRLIRVSSSAHTAAYSAHACPVMKMIELVDILLR